MEIKNYNNNLDSNKKKEEAKTIELEEMKIELKNTIEKKNQLDQKIKDTALDVLHIRQCIKEVKSEIDKNKKTFIALVKEYKKNENKMKKHKENINLYVEAINEYSNSLHEIKRDIEQRNLLIIDLDKKVKEMEDLGKNRTELYQQKKEDLRRNKSEIEIQNKNF